VHVRGRLEVEHEARSGDVARAGGDAGFSYSNRFACLPSALAFRPARTTPRPRVDGCQTAEVVGPAGEQIFTDKYGRVKVQFDWDRDGQKNASSSCWVRVATALAGNQYGGIHIPRIGQEVVVDFLEGDPDRPIVVGSVYNANQMPPYALPDNKSQSGFKFAAVGQGGSAVVNELRFEDKAGSEQVYFQAAKDEVWNVEHDRTTTVKNNDTRTVTEGNDVVTVSQGNRDVTVTQGNLTTKVDQGDETHTVGTGKLTVTVESDLSTTVNTGNRATVVKTGNDTTAVDTGNYTMQVKTGNHETTVDAGNITITASAGKCTVEAAQEILLKVGGSSIKITPQGVEITGSSMIKLAATASQIQMTSAAIEVKSVATKVQASGALQMRAGGAAGLAGGGALVLEGGAMTQVNGGVVMIN
jgi:type VI secretion system secreted protein VgrG